MPRHPTLHDVMNCRGLMNLPLFAWNCSEEHRSDIIVAREPDHDLGILMF
jgi:hypothetical protein